VFTDLAVDLAARSSGIHAFTADGAWRGTHLNHVQTITGCGVITPGRRRTARHDGIVIDSHGYAAQPLPWSRRRTAVKHSAAGTNYGRPPAPCSSKPSPRRRQRLHRADPAPDQTRHYPPQERNRAAPVLRPLHPALPRSETHDWWEPLLPVTGDTTARFNRCEYLRVVPTTSPRHRKLYGMRQDTESLNAQLERAFYSSRLPAWGAHNQTTIVLLAALADNAWTRRVWYDEVRRQADPPGAPAAA